MEPFECHRDSSFAEVHRTVAVGSAQECQRPISRKKDQEERPAAESDKWLREFPDLRIIDDGTYDLAQDLLDSEMTNVVVVSETAKVGYADRQREMADNICCPGSFNVMNVVESCASADHLGSIFFVPEQETAFVAVELSFHANSQKP